MVKVVLDDSDENDVVALNSDKQHQRRRSIDSLSLRSLGSTSSRDKPPQTRRQPVYNDVLPPNTPYWVEINPTPEFNREDYHVDDEEFNIVGIFGEVGEGVDVQYEVQFEDDRIVTVIALFVITLISAALE
jgi:hypothetical protein